MGSVLHAIGAFSARRKWIVVAIWTALLAGVATAAVTLSGETDDGFSIPGAESVITYERLGEAFPSSAGATGTIVIAAPEGAALTDPDAAAAIAASVAELAALQDVLVAQDPFQSQAVTPTLDIAYITVNYALGQDELPDTTLADAEAASAAMVDAGLRVEYAGAAYNVFETPGGVGEVVGAIVAIIVLLITLRTLIGAITPFITGIAAVGLGVGTIYALTGSFAISETAPILALMLGLAVGIDYSLFIVARHRTQLMQGMSVRDSIARATATSGSAVVFAGATVVVALLALAIARIPFLTAMGNAAAGTVALAVLVALTLLPAVLAIAGHRILTRGQRRTLSETGGLSDVEPSSGKGISFVTKHPIVTVLAVVAVLGTMAFPVTDMRLGLPTDRSQSEESSARQAYDLLEEGFGAGFNGPILVLAESTADSAEQGYADASAAAEAIAGLDNVQFATPAVPSEEGVSYLVQVIPTTGPDSVETEQLVNAIADLETPAELALGVTGETAIRIDVSESIAEALPTYLAVVVGLALLLLLIVFRSVLVPLKALAGFLLTLGATLGSVVAVFQWGWLADLLGVEYTGPIVAFLPILVIGITFGLAMDYQVFLVSRMREEYVHGMEARRAIVVGHSHSARVVTAAALIMASVFMGFLLDPDAIIKSMGFALAIGVLIDAFVVRMTLVPAVMTLLGKSAWWLPRWLDRVVPRVDIEGDSLAEQPAK